MRRHLSFANVVSLCALFVALGGTSYAVIHLGRGVVKNRNLAKNAVTSSKVKNGSLLSKDFKGGQLPAGAQGPKGDTGPQGPKGDTGPSTGTAGGDLSGNYPNPAIAAGAVGPSKLATLPMARILLSGTTIPGTLGTVVPGTEVADTAGLHDDSVNPSRLTAPTAGTYVVAASLRWGASAGDHSLHLLKNGATIVASNIASATSGFVPINATSAVVRLAAGDYIEAEGSQDSGVSQNTGVFQEESQFSMAFIGP